MPTPLPYMARATANKDSIDRCSRYACVYCVEIYATEDRPVETYIQDRAGPTAVCPTCQIDAVVPLGVQPEPLSEEAALEVLADWHVSGFGG